MSVYVMSWVWKHGPTNPTERLVLLAIADHCDDEGRAFPSMAGIAEKACCTERGARGIVRRLQDSGWLDVRVGGGRGGKSHYTVRMLQNPERETRNDIPGMGNTERETRNGSARNPEGDCTKPGTRVPPNHQGTIKEPSESNDAREIRDALCEQASPAAVSSFIAYRRKQKGKALTLTAAKRQAKQLRQIFDNGGDPDDALGMAEERGWQSVQSDWYFKAKGPTHGKRSDDFSHPGCAANAPDADWKLRSIARAAGSFEAPGWDRGDG